MYSSLQYQDAAGEIIAAVRESDGVFDILEPGHANWEDVKAGAYGEILAHVLEPITEDMVRAEGARRLALLVAEYSDRERETWGQQIAEAAAFTADNTAVVPILSGVAAGRGVGVSDIAALVEQKSTEYAQASGQILGAQSALLRLDPIPQDYDADSHWLPETTDTGAA